MKTKFELTEFTLEDIRDIQPILTEIRVEDGTKDISPNMRWGQIMAIEECVLALEQLRTVAIFHFGIMENTFIENYMSLHLDTSMDIQEFYRQLSVFSELPAEILNVLLSTQVYAFEIGVSRIQCLKRYCFPKTEEQKKSYLDIFNGDEGRKLLAESFYIHRQRMQLS